MSATQKTLSYPTYYHEDKNNNELKDLAKEAQKDLVTAQFASSSFSAEQAKTHESIKQAYARVMQLTYYGYQLRDAKDKSQAQAAVSDLTRSLKGITKLNCGNNVAQAMKYLKGVHNRAKKYENLIKALLDQARISSTAYGTPAFNTNTLLGINFADELITKANQASALNNELNFIVHTEDDESITLSSTDIEKLLNDPKSTVTYQVVLPGQVINEDGWRDLTTGELEDLKKDNKGILYARTTHPVTQEEKVAIEDEVSKQPSYNRPPKKDDDEKDEIDILVEELNEMIRHANPDWGKISEILDQNGIQISPEDLKTLFNPETMDFNHVFRPDPQFKYFDPTTGTWKAHMSGHHLDKGLCKITKTKTTPLPGGATQSNIDFEGLLKFDNCYFPADWTEKDVVRAVIEVLRNPKEVFLDSQKLFIEGTHNNVKMTVMLTKSKLIKTAYPNRI